MAIERVLKVACDVPNCDAFFLGADQETYKDVNERVLAAGWVFHPPEFEHKAKLCVCPEHAPILRIDLRERLRSFRHRQACKGKGTT